MPVTGDCPGCGRPVGPAVTLQPGARDPLPSAPLVPGHLERETEHRVPVAPLVLLAIACAVMGLVIGVNFTGRREVPVRRPEARLPALPPPGPALDPSMAPIAPQMQPNFPRLMVRPPLPPARVTPPEFPRPGVGPASRWGAARSAPSRPPVSPPTPPSPAASGVPPKAPGMATVRVSNPSGTPVDVKFAGDTEQSGVVGPHASVDFPIPTGRYNITLGSGPRPQRFYDAPLREGELLALVYQESLTQRRGE
jgi:hypothetical protein